MITERFDYVCIVARDIFAGDFEQSQVPEVVEGAMRGLNRRAREWYFSRTHEQLKRFDADVWKRANYLRSFVEAQAKTIRATAPDPAGIQGG